VHRDVKPGNILVDGAEGKPAYAYLSDFGLTKGASSTTGITVSGQFLGTLDYCAPEQITGQRADGRSDQYALACVAFTVLTGTVPFERPDSVATLFAHVNDPVPAVSALRAGIPPATDAVLTRAMAKDPAQRFLSCGEFAESLRAALAVADEPVRSSVPGHASPEPLSAPAVGDRTVAAVASHSPAADGDSASRTVTATAPEIPAAAAGGPPTPGRARIGSRRRKIAFIASAAACVLAVAGTVTALTLAHSNLPTGPATLAATFTLPGNDSAVSAWFSADGNDVGIGSSAHIYILDTHSHRYIKTLTLPNGEQSVIGAAFSADDKTLTTLDFNGIAYRWDLSTGNRVTVNPVPAVPTPALSGDGSTLATEDSGHDGINLWDVTTGAHISQLTDPDAAPVAAYGITLDEDGHTAAVDSTNGMVYVWNTETQKVIATLRYAYFANAAANLYGPVLSPDGKTVEISDTNRFGLIRGSPALWSVATGANITPDDPRWQDDGFAFFSGDGQFCATDLYRADVKDDETVDLWDIATRTLLVSVGSSSRNAGPIWAFGPGGRELLTSKQTGDAKHFSLWDIA
jgi:hypothetical protein